MQGPLYCVQNRSAQAEFGLRQDRPNRKKVFVCSKLHLVDKSILSLRKDDPFVHINRNIPTMLYSLTGRRMATSNETQ